MLPLVNRPVPIIADAAVEREFGTGAVKVTPAHDPTDYEIGAAARLADADRHRFRRPHHRAGVAGRTRRRDARASRRRREALAKYVGLDRFEARKVLVADLEAAGALVRVEPYETTVPISSRSGEIIEPLLSLQWFCAMESLAKPALDAYRDGRVRFVPERFGRTYEHGLENIRDWNISRQVWWGHQLPVWYTPDGDADRGRDGRRSAREAQDALRNRRTAARSRHARHLVLERAVAVLDPRLAGANARTRRTGIPTKS